MYALVGLLYPDGVHLAHAHELLERPEKWFHRVMEQDKGNSNKEN